MRHDGSRSQLIAHNAIVDLRVDRPFVETDAATAGSAGFNAVAETLDDVSFARARFILEGDQKSAGRRLISRRIVVAGPRIDVHHSVWGHHHLPGVTDLIGEYGGAKTCG